MARPARRASRGDDRPQAVAYCPPRFVRLPASWMNSCHDACPTPSPPRRPPCSEGFSPPCRPAIGAGLPVAWCATAIPLRPALWRSFANARCSPGKTASTTSGRTARSGCWNASPPSACAKSSMLAPMSENGPRRRAASCPRRGCTPSRSPPRRWGSSRRASPLSARARSSTQVGLGEREGAVTIFVDPEDSTATSTLPLAVEFNPGVQRTKQAERLTASITTGDAYLARHGIATVDLLKIDVEGAEPKVLAGFSEAMASGRVRLIQFEYGWMNAHTGATLKSFYQLLVPLGFRIGKLYPEGVAFKPYAYGDEDFLGPNYVACHESWPEAMAALRCPPLGP
ncbi:MAG: FkbM family methyltransferase [Acetobacteraceae bacterium]|nr:FkbM family methyltransferase [Acetobacteraceae bacterium]